MRSVLSIAALMLMVAPVAAEEVTLTPARDNTIYEPQTDVNSNGRGSHLFAGATAFPLARRALLAFDLASVIPPGSTIESVSLRLFVSRGRPGRIDVSAHRVLADWGEGDSDAPGQEGIGGLAMPGDATWLHTFSPDQFWSTEGGDFAATASATTPVDFSSFYSWSASGMVADVQVWVDQPELNFGWILIGDESATGTAKRFDSREYPVPDRRPMLTIEFTPPPPSVPTTTAAGAAVLLGILACAGTVFVRQIGRARG